MLLIKILLINNYLVGIVSKLVISIEIAHLLDLSIVLDEVVLMLPLDLVKIYIWKRGPDSPIGGKVTFENSFTQFHSTTVSDYIISYTREDGRPYLEISILGFTMLGLLDSGVSRTIVGSSDYEVFKNLGLKLVNQTSHCTAANGESYSTFGKLWK